jgi:hypothetical protein
MAAEKGRRIRFQKVSTLFKAFPLKSPLAASAPDRIALASVHRDC